MFPQLLEQERKRPLKKPAIEYLRSFYGDTATFTRASIDCAVDFLGADHVIFGSDAPFDAEGGMFSIRECTNAINQSTMSAGDKSKIFYKNFETLFRIPASVPAGKV